MTRKLTLPGNRSANIQQIGKHLFKKKICSVLVRIMRSMAFELQSGSFPSSPQLRLMEAITLQAGVAGLQGCLTHQFSV